MSNLKRNIAIKLLKMERDEDVERILYDSWNEYKSIIDALLIDIYDSCIKEYYSQYTPMRYTRHGNINGFNLYRAKSFDMDMFNIVPNVEAYNLLRYAGKDGGYKREIVLDMVMDGYRGGPGAPGFPMEWYASYPNDYSNSRYENIWQSSYHTLREILDDFDENIFDDTADLFYKIIDRNI